MGGVSFVTPCYLNQYELEQNSTTVNILWEMSVEVHGYNHTIIHSFYQYIEKKKLLEIETIQKLSNFTHTKVSGLLSDMQISERTTIISVGINNK